MQHNQYTITKATLPILLMLFVGFFFPLTIYAQTIDRSVVQLPIKDTLITYEKVIILDSTVKKEQLFKVVMAWASSAPNRVIKVSNPAINQVGGYGAAQIYVGTFGKVVFDVLYIFSVNIKNGQYHITLTDFSRKLSDGTRNAQLKDYYRIDRIYTDLQRGSSYHDIKTEKNFFKYLNEHAWETMKSIEKFVHKSLGK